MQGKKQCIDRVITQFRLCERVPAHNLYRRLDGLLDLHFLYEATQDLYSHTGHPSLDPVVFFKLVLVGRLENLVSDRRLLAHCALRLDILLFLGYGLDEALPWHSTVSRTRQLYPAALFEQLFNRVFAMCVAQGLVAGDTHAVDSAPVKANASLESMQEKQPAAVGVQPSASLLTAPAHQLRNEVTRQTKRQSTPGALGATHTKARLLSNKTHYSTTDSDARVSVKPGKARALNYLCSLAVDTAHGVISHAQADLADCRDSVHLPSIVRSLQPRLQAQGLHWQELLADAGYANGSNYAFLEERGITPWIPVFGQYKAEIEGFTYDLETDAYTCSAGKSLPFRKYDTSVDGSWLKIYWAAYQDCHHCPLKSTCVPTAQRKQLTRTAYDPACRRAWARQQSRQGQVMRRKRQSTVEPVFGNLIHHYGLRRVGTRGKASAQKTMLLAAIAYNLKKLLKYQPRKCGTIALALPPPSSLYWILVLRTRRPVANSERNKNSTTKKPCVLQQPPPYFETSHPCPLTF